MAKAYSLNHKLFYVREYLKAQPMTYAAFAEEHSLDYKTLRRWVKNYAELAKAEVIVEPNTSEQTDNLIEQNSIQNKMVMITSVEYQELLRYKVLFETINSLMIVV